MRRDNQTDFRKKDLARRKYNERQIDKFIKWSVEQKGYLKYKLDIFSYPYYSQLLNL